MKNKFAGIIFDLDGTLVDSERVWHMAETRLVESRGHTYRLEDRALVLGLRIDEAMLALRDHFDFGDDIPALVSELNLSMVDLVAENVVARPGAGELIEYVVQRGIPHAIASASPQIVIDAIVEHMGWLPYFPVRCSADDEAHGKPAPDVYLTAARRVNVAPNACLAIEDTPAGARAAVSAGMTCFVVPDHMYSKPHMFDGVTPHVYSGLPEILRTLHDQF
ncbi:MAG: HAD family phosphatase [Anaerolineae bacterium]|nr:HAD family phosphatase [Anaerolineae bacterium]